MATYSAEEYYYKLNNMIFSSCQVFRKLFQTRWMKITGKTWEETEEQGQKFIDGEGKTIYQRANTEQKEKIVKACLDEWDITILSMVLQNFGNPEDYHAENEVVRKIKDMRNDLAHHSTQKIRKEEYNEKVDLFRAGLRALQVKDEVIEKMVEKAGLTSSVAALEATKKLFEVAEKSIKTQKFEEAIVSLDEATTMQSLLPVHQGVTFEKRADCYLKFAQQKKQRQLCAEADKCCDQALLDATKALELNDNSWKAHHLLAQCHRWQNHFGKALHHYQTALAISPVQQPVKNELDSCKAVAGWRNRDETTDPRNLPLTFAEALDNLEEKNGIRLTEEEFIELKGDVEGKVFKGQENVLQGRLHANGWGVPQNYEEAVRYFAKAAKVKNAEGIFNLGICYRHGRGVKQNLKKAYDLYLEAAQMSAEIQITGLSNFPQKNVGVVGAQHCVGVFHEYGIVVEQDYWEAVMWYKKATKNGNGTSAFNLGLMYAEGRGVPKNLKTAESYWNQRVILKEPKAAEYLVQYYIHELEPGRARAMFETGKKLQSVALNGISEEEFNAILHPKINYRQEHEKKVIVYEIQNKLGTKGMTFLERVKRYSFTVDPNVSQFLKDLEEMQSNQSWGGQIKPLNNKDLMQLLRLASEGSITADHVWKAMVASKILCDFLHKMEIFPEEATDTITVLNLLYDFITLELGTGVLLSLPSYNSKSILKKVTAQLLMTKCDGRKSEDDMKIRFCHAYFNKIFAQESIDTSMMKLLEEGIKKYPENVHYYHALTDLYGLCGNHKSGLFFAEEGLKKFPDNPCFLFAKASHLHMLPKNPDCKQSIATYKLFLSKAPSDHRQVPEAYYTIASIYGLDQGSGKSAAILISKMEHYFNLGKESEANMLPCYLPYESRNKLGVEDLLRIAQAEKPSSSNSFFNVESSEELNILEKKQYLNSPVRKQLILEHRNDLSSLAKMKETLGMGLSYSDTTVRNPPKLNQTTPRRMSRVKLITLKEMNPTTDTIYKDRMIEFTIMEDPLFDFIPDAVHLVVEDENGDLSRLCLYNMERNKDIEEKLSFGSELAILNPYMRIGKVDGTNGIRNDEPGCVLFRDKVVKMCRFCGEENAPEKCSECNRASYCNRECQELDWKMMKHKLICGK